MSSKIITTFQLSNQSLCSISWCESNSCSDSFSLSYDITCDISKYRIQSDQAIIRLSCHYHTSSTRYWWHLQISCHFLYIWSNIISCPSISNRYQIISTPCYWLDLGQYSSTIWIAFLRILYIFISSQWSKIITPI